MEMWSKLCPHPGVVVDNWEGWFHTHVWQLRIERDVFAMEVLHVEKEVCPTPGPLAKIPVKREVPIASGCESLQGLWLSETEGCWSPGSSSYRTWA